MSPIAPSLTRFIVSRTAGEYRQQRPETSDRFFSFALAAAAMLFFSPGTSSPCGFSQKTCLPASIAAVSITG